MRVGLALPHYDFSLAVRRSGLVRAPSRRRRSGPSASGSTRCGCPITSSCSLARYGGDADRYGSLEPMTTLAALAPMTSRVRLGTLVLSRGLPSPRARREGGLGDRPALRRSPRPRPRSRVVRRRVRGVRLPVRLGGRAVRAARGDRRVPRGAVRRRAGVVPREAVRDARGVQPSEARPGAAAAAAAAARGGRGCSGSRDASRTDGTRCGGGRRRATPPRRGRPRSVRAFRTRSRAVPPVARPVHRGRRRRGRRRSAGTS